MKKFIIFVSALLPMVLFAESDRELAHTIGQIAMVVYIVAFGYFTFLTLYVFKIQQQKELTYQRRAMALFSGFFFCNLVAVAFTVLLLNESNDIFLASKSLLSENSVVILMMILSVVALLYPNQIVRFCSKNEAV